MKSICGINCMNCELSGVCNGCAATEGRPFGAECLVAQCCKKGKAELSELKGKLISAFNSLHISDMEEVTELNQLYKKDSDRCYGIIADEKYLMVSEYSGFGADAEIIVFKRWD